MSKQWMSSLVESSLRRKSYGRKLAGLAASVIVQGVFLAALILYPLMVIGAHPFPHEVASLLVPRILKVKPPSPARVPKPRPYATGVRFTGGSFIVPSVVPAEITEDIDFFEETALPVTEEIDFLGEMVARLRSTPVETAKPEPVRVGGLIKSPTKIHDVRPVYPEVARAARVQGVVILEAVIDEQGNVVHLRLLRSAPLLDHAAMDAVRQWKYTPTFLNGVPVPIVMTVTVQFVLS